MEKYLIVWPKSQDVVHINYHYTQFGECIDYLNQFFPEQIIAIDCDIEDKNIVEVVKQNKISKIVMQVNYENAQEAFKLAEKIKEKSNSSILAYGSIPIMLPKLFLNSKFDAILKNGDAEVCIKSFLRHYHPEDSVSELQRQLKGINLIRNQEFIPTEDGQYISPDNWGISKQKNVPIEQYDKMKGKNRYVLNISRGCPYGCPHCLIQLTEGRKERRRSIENLRQSIKEIEGKYKHIKIWAANFTLNKEYVEKFCQMMEENYPDITWECATRIDLVQDREMLKRMHDAGCRQISLGIESINNAELIHTKDFRTKEIATAISNIQESGIQVKGCIMLGMPNQTKESMVETLKFLLDRNVLVRPTIYTPYQHLTPDVRIEDLGKYNRKTYENDQIQGVSTQQLLQLVKKPQDYKEILGENKVNEEKQGTR